MQSGQAGRLSIHADNLPGQGALCRLPVRTEGRSYVIDKEKGEWILCLAPGVGDPAANPGLVPTCRMSDLTTHGVTIPDEIAKQLQCILDRDTCHT